jgi:DNA-directed RNA polymerase subunit RPC12/RpoP
MDLNVCAACGEWSDDFLVADGEPALVCPACGHRRWFARLPLLALTGPSAGGKSAVGTILAGRLEQCVVLEQNLLWLPDQLDPADQYRQFRRLRLVAALHQNGRPVLLCATVVPGNWRHARSGDWSARSTIWR